MPVLWGYSPVRMLARLGQQRESVTNPFLKFTPGRTISARVCFIAHSESQRWSSVRMSTMLGLGGGGTCCAVAGTELTAVVASRRTAASGRNVRRSLDRRVV